MQPDDVVEASHTTRGGVRPPATRLAFVYRKTVLPIATAAHASNLKPLVAFKSQESPSRLQQLVPFVACDRVGMAKYSN